MSTWRPLGDRPAGANRAVPGAFPENQRVHRIRVVKLNCAHQHSSMQATYPAFREMNLIRFLKQTALFRQLTDELFAPDADLLPPGRRMTASTLLFNALAATFLLVAAFGGMGATMMSVGQACLYLLSIAALPSLCLTYTGRRWSRNPPLSLMGFLLALVALPNMLVSDVTARLLPMVDAWFTGLGGNWRWLTFAAGLVASLAHLLVLKWRKSVLADLRHEVARQRTRADEALLGRQLAEARLQTLQAQIEPHFLYNTLANVQALIAHRPAAAEDMLTSLIHYLRESLPRMRSTASTLQQEFALAQAYLDIARIRFGGRLRVEVELLESVAHTAFPPLIVQTLVENALKHGVEPKVGAATVRLEAFEDAGSIVVQVTDDGPGFGEIPGRGTGLRNIRERLSAIYGERATLVIQPNSPSGVTATVAIPREAS